MPWHKKKGRGTIILEIKKIGAWEKRECFERKNTKRKKKKERRPLQAKSEKVDNSSNFRFVFSVFAGLIHPQTDESTLPELQFPQNLHENHGVHPQKLKIVQKRPENVFDRPLNPLQKLNQPP